MFELIETFKFQSLDVVYKMRTLESLKRLREDKRGVTAMEYGLIAALIGVAAVSAMNGLGTQLIARLNQIANTLRP